MSKPASKQGSQTGSLEQRRMQIQSFARQPALLKNTAIAASSTEIPVVCTRESPAIITFVDFCHVHTGIV